MRFHDLRHTAATLLLGRGVNPKIVSEMLGHWYVSVRLGIYSHVLPHMQREAASAMDATLGGSGIRPDDRSRVDVSSETQTRMTYSLDLDFAKCETGSGGEEGKRVRIIAKSRLMAQAAAYGDCVRQVTDWYNLASRATWRNLSDVRQTFRHADVVGDKTVFNIKGNDYQLIVHIRYEVGIIYIKQLLTHAEYDKDTWKA